MDQPEPKVTFVDSKIEERQGITLPLLGAPFAASALPAAAAAAIGVYGVYGDELLYLYNLIFGKTNIS